MPLWQLIYYSYDLGITEGWFFFAPDLNQSHAGVCTAQSSFFFYGTSPAHFIHAFLSQTTESSNFVFLSLLGFLWSSSHFSISILWYTVLQTPIMLTVWLLGSKINRWILWILANFGFGKSDSRGEARFNTFRRALVALTVQRLVESQIATLTQCHWWNLSVSCQPTS